MCGGLVPCRGSENVCTNPVMAGRLRRDLPRDWGRATARWSTVVVLLAVGWLGPLIADWGLGHTISSDGTVPYSYSGFLWWIPSLIAVIAAARLATDGPGPRRRIAVGVAVLVPAAVLIRWLLGFAFLS